MQAQAAGQHIRDEAATFLKRIPTDEEMAEALPQATKKLHRIINNYGDDNGIRRQPWYLGKLIEEAIIENEFSLYTMARCIEIQARREAAAAGEN